MNGVNNPNFANLNAVIEAVMIQHQGPNTNHFDDARLFLESFRNSIQCIGPCLQLFSTNQSDEVRHFSLQSLSMVANRDWNKLTRPQKNELKNTSVELLKNSKPMLEEKRFIKERIVDFVCTLAICDWPSSRPKFFKEMLEIPNNNLSEKVLELVLMVLKNMRSEIEINFKLPLQKREDIKNTMKSYNGEIYNLIEATISCSFQIYESSKQNNQKTQFLEAEQLISIALDCLQQNITFPLTQLFSNNLIDLLCNLASNNIFYKKTMSCLVIICSRKYVCPVKITTSQYNSKLFCIWKLIVGVLESLLKEASNISESEEFFELLIELSKNFIRNYKNITYKLVDNKINLRERFVMQLGQIFAVQSKKPLVSLFELWKTMFENKFFSNLKNYSDIKKGIFTATFKKINMDPNEYETIDDLAEIKKNLLSTALLLMRKISESDKTLFIELLAEAVKVQVEITKQYNEPITSKEDKIYVQWDNLLKILRLAFTRNIYSAMSFKMTKNKSMILKCEETLQALLFEPKDPLINEIILRFLFRFYPLYYINNNALKYVLNHTFKIFQKFPIPPPMTLTEKSKNILIVRRAAIFCLISLSRTCRQPLSVLFDDIYQTLNNVMNASNGEEDMSGFLEVLLNISDVDSLRIKRNNMIHSTLQDSTNKITSSEMENCFKVENLPFLLKGTAESEHVRQVIRVTVNSTISLLAGMTKGQISYSTEHHMNYISVPLLNSFQFDETWGIVKSFLPFIAQFCKALNCAHENMNELDLDARLALYGPEKMPPEIKVLAKNDINRFQRIKQVSNWLNDFRESCYNLMNSASNLSDTYFTSDPNFMINTMLYKIESIPYRFMKLLTEKFIAPITIRCCAAAPQYISSFLVPLLSKFFEAVYSHLIEGWKALKIAEMRDINSNAVEEEISSIEELRLFTRSISKFLFSLSLDIILESPFQKQKSKNKSKNLNRSFKSKSGGLFKNNINLFKELFKNQKAAESLCGTLMFYLRVSDSIARNNIYRFLSQLFVFVGLENVSFFLEILCEAFRLQPVVLEVDDSLADFVVNAIQKLSKQKMDLKNALANRLGDQISQEDLDFLLNSFRSKEFSLQKKKVRQFLLKLSGEEGAEIFVEKVGLLTDSVHKKRRNSQGRAGENTSYVDPTNLSFLFEDES